MPYGNCYIHCNYTTKVCQHKANADKKRDPNLLSI